MSKHTFQSRFRGFLPVVVDVETGGFNPKTDALLEVAAVYLNFNDDNQLTIIDSKHYHIEPFPGANLEQSALDFIGLDPNHPFRFAISESEAIESLCQKTRQHVKQQQCNKAVLVGHNPMFDLSFLQAAFNRTRMKRVPFHSFTTLDTATLAALSYGQTVLAKAMEAAKIEFDADEAHSAIYDAEKTAQLFCQIVNNTPFPLQPDA